MKCIASQKILFSSIAVVVYLVLAVQPGVARAFALRAELGRFAPLALLSFVASRLLNPEMNRLPM